MMLLSDRRNLHVAIILPLQDRPERFRHGFTGKEFDSWTGLYNYGFRDYAPLYGRFTTVDPIQDGHNWYSYVNSDPVSWLDPWGLKGQESGEDEKRNAEPNEISKVYFIYVYKTDNERDQKMKASERKSINDEIKFLQDNGVSVTVIENGTYEDIKEALEDKNIKMLVTSGHGTRGGSIETSTGGRFSPSDLENINVSGSLKTVIFENCYQGGSNKKTDDNEKRWEEAFGENVDVVGWKDTTTTAETKSFNGCGWFDRQPRNLRSYCEDILNTEE